MWKERNRQVFEAITTTPARVFSLIKEEINLRSAAMREELERDFGSLIMLFHIKYNKFFKFYVISNL